MDSYYVRQDGAKALGPYAADAIRAWIAEGRLARDVECSKDGDTWLRASQVDELGVPAAAPQAFPELSLFIRQGANVQGPFTMTRIRGYVAQRRIQPYMLFSQDGVYLLGPEHVPGLIPDGYVAVPPSRGASAVPSTPAAPGTPAPASPASPASPAATSAAPPPSKEIGSTTLFGYRLDEAEVAPAAIPASRPTVAPIPVAPVAVPAPTYYVRDDAQQVYGPYTEDALRPWIAEGRIRPDMEYSHDGRTWILGTNVPALFPGAVSGRIPGARPPGETADWEEPAAPSGWRRFRRRK